MSSPLPDIRTAPSSLRPILEAEMNALRSALDVSIPTKRLVTRNIIIGTWNIREFGRLTTKWASTGQTSPKRNWRGLHVIAEIVSRFDVVAIQEITGDLAALRTLIKTLGPNWGFLITDINQGDPGGGERMGFIYDQTRVQPSGLAGELSVPDDRKFLRDLTPDEQFRQFARTPYAVSFRAGLDTFILVTAHVIYGDSSDNRTAELTAMAEWMADWAQRATRYHQNLLLLGDFNIDRADDDNFKAFTSTGLTVPAKLNSIPRTIFEGTKDKFYDQIAWFEKGTRRRLNLEFTDAGGFDFSDLVFTTEPKMTRNSLSYRVSDHLPLWVEFLASNES